VGRGSAYNGGSSDAGPAVPLALVKRVGLENATAIRESRTTCWEFME
jgi:hypothetical protein